MSFLVPFFQECKMFALGAVKFACSIGPIDLQCSKDYHTLSLIRTQYHKSYQLHFFRTRHVGSAEKQDFL